MLTKTNMWCDAGIKAINCTEGKQRPLPYLLCSQIAKSDPDKREISRKHAPQNDVVSAGR